VGLVQHPAQHRGDRVHDRYLGIPEQQYAVVDAPFRVRFEPVRVRGSRVDGVRADQQPARWLTAHRGGQHRRPVEQQRPHPAVRPAQHRDRARRTEINTQPATTQAAAHLPAQVKTPVP
jgi:hypothetical protein